MEHEICIQCGAEVRPEEAYHVAEEAVCPSCAETDTVVCSYCGERIWRENDFGDSDTALCEACYTNHYTRCNQCGRLISFSAAYYQDEDEDEETPYCSACYHECGEAIHGYSYKPVPIFHGDAPMYMGAVSYTHLDVYKRQIQMRIVRAVFCWLAGPKIDKYQIAHN